MLSDDDSEPKAAFPERTCERCGRRGGGRPNAGMENVGVVYDGLQLCGHCTKAMDSALFDMLPQLAREWVDKHKLEPETQHEAAT